jgi:hypothetical protein
LVERRRRGFTLFGSPRDDCAATIKTARSMGVDVKMMTGDHEGSLAKSPGRSISAGTSWLRIKSSARGPVHIGAWRIRNSWIGSLIDCLKSVTVFSGGRGKVP